MKIKVFQIAIFFIFVSCAHRGSGHYIRSSSNDTWKSISQRYGIPIWKIRAANSHRRVASDNWIFIPLKRGLLGLRNVNFPLEAMFNSRIFTWPVPSSKKISSRFGKRWGRPHEGIDIPARLGASIVAAADGVVIYSGNGLGGYGNLTVLAHQNGFFTVYAHAKRNYTRKGQKVYRGQVIALMGRTGRTTGTHLHFEVRYDSKAINPSHFGAFR